jgi:pantoate kinase
MFLNTTYNNFIKSQLTKFFGRKNIMTDVTRVPNYTDEMVDSMVADYTDSPTPETVAKLASEFSKTTRSIVAKLVREGVYKAQQRVTKTGAPVVRKAELVAQIQEQLGVEVPTLEKASKADLEALVVSITTMSER